MIDSNPTEFNPAEALLSAIMLADRVALRAAAKAARESASPPRRSHKRRSPTAATRAKLSATMKLRKTQSTMSPSPRCSTARERTNRGDHLMPKSKADRDWDDRAARLRRYFDRRREVILAIAWVEGHDVEPAFEDFKAADELLREERKIAYS